MKILVINCGSSSVKFQFINVQNGIVLAKGLAERIGENTSLFTYRSDNFTEKQVESDFPDHESAVQKIIECLLDHQKGIIKKTTEIDAVGHRLVHGGEFYSNSVIVDNDVIEVLRKCSVLAPLHNPANIKGIEAILHILPKIQQCGIFDTAFHQTLPSKAFLYPLPLDFYSKHKIRRYGFHGTSHKYVSQIAADFVGKNIQHLKIISAHIGNGASITAIKDGKSVDTSMGFTPLEGLMMGTRCGDIDPAIPVYLQKQMGMDADTVDAVLNKKSGMLGLSGLSNDMREIEEAILSRQNPDAKQALEVYTYRIKKYIGAYTAVMNGLDVLIFTGGAGENMPILRSLVCENLDYLGVVLDEKKNEQSNEGITDLTHKESSVKILKVPTNEELMIARETQRLLAK
ncbi:MAG: acetate kinase [Candidatus Cloacimonetes bacterium]|nr:acetate kinase [Candidatus Cloacimonadota bacterium]